MNIDPSFVYLKIPAEVWSLLEETLRADTQSKNFDQKLRADIEMALGEIEELQNPKGKSNLFKHHANGVIATERVLFTLQKYWNVKVLMQSDDLILVQHPFTTKRDYQLSYKLFLLSDNGSEVNIEFINNSHHCDSVS